MGNRLNKRSRTQHQERIITRKPNNHILAFQHPCTTAQGRVLQPERIVLADHAGQSLAQNNTIQRWEVPDHVEAQPIAVTLGKLLQPIQRPVSTLAGPVGVAVEDEPALEPRLNQIA